MPSPEDYPEGRLFSLDVLRGLDMFYLVVVSPVLGRLFRAAGVNSAVRDFFCVHPWEGFTLYDLIMPLFIFMCGAAIPYALRSRLDAEGRPTEAFHRHVWSRFALLWVLGMLSQGDLQSLDIHKLSPYNNTLQTIAVGYVVAAYIMLVRSWTVRIAVPCLLAAAYGLVVHFGGDYTQDGNITMAVELKILRCLLPADNAQTANVVKYGYTWFLPSMIFPVIALAGAYATEILRSKVGDWQKARNLGLFGVGALGLGFVLSLMGVKVVKHIFTVSFTFEAIGWSVLLLALLYVMTDIWRWRKGTGILLLFGQFALTAYMYKQLVEEGVVTFVKRNFSGVLRFFPGEWYFVALAAILGLATICFVVIRRRLGRWKAR